MSKSPLFLIVDLFCGAGGVTTGFDQAVLPARILSDYYVGPNYMTDGFTKLCKIIACVNHDHKAIESHWRNHPDVQHFKDDIRKVNMKKLLSVVDYWRKKYPNAYLILHASLECTNFSKAKGGKPRDADSRTLAEHLYRYIKALQPDYITIENVVEFMSWGPLDENGKPVSRKNGQDWIKWRNKVKEFGYYDDWKEMNSADFGAYTSRNRLFGIFAKPGLPIAWPAPTHAKKPVDIGMFGGLQKWKAVKEVLNFEDQGESIFNRKKPLTDKTLERIFAGLVKYVAKGDKAFISKYFSGRPKGKVNSVDQPSSTITTFGGSTLVQTVSYSDLPIDGPAGTITTVDHHALIQVLPVSMLKYNSTNGVTGEHVPPSVEDPCPVISTQGRLGIVQAEFLALNYSSGGQLASIENPCPTLSTKDRISVVKPEFFIDKHFGSNQNQSIDQPAGVVMPNDKHRLVEAVPFIMPTSYDNTPKSIDEPAPTIQASRRHHYIVNPSHGGHCTSTENPCPVIIARQDKAPLSLIQVENGPFMIPIYDTDSEVMVRIKKFMVMFNLVDIKMRMLRVLELLRIQGFPDHYTLAGNQSEQKKFIGNSVVPLIMKVWAEALGQKLIESQSKVA